ncbi:ABC transporter permease [Alteromonas sp. 5E99-2]|uniref:ABC transporter permease n=1 Tax=Alteromonas sp. 5E99-2 TaxID=2817683 RepID=UPI001A97DB3C|nr:ABC transporter permease [Alteromonas sp. 5E99-2]MBO1256045.1 ABC transporter permease [Alteromonas sp. 5E99-2]
MWIVFKKELKEILRDKKTLFFMIALPLLIIPAIGGVVGYFSVKAVTEAEEKILKVSIVNPNAAPQITEELQRSEFFEIVPIESGVTPEQWVKSKGADFVLTMPDSYTAPLLESNQRVFVIHLNDAGLNLVERRLKEIIEPYLNKQQQTAFQTLNLSEEQSAGLIEPFVFDKIDVADKRENIGEKVGGMLTYFIFILCLQGAMMPAADLGAGEKERGTLETLLISPIERKYLVLGKFLTIALAGVMTALITVLSMAIWGIVLSQGMAIQFVAEFMGAINAIDFVLIFFMLIPIVSILASILLSISTYARSFKEAQSYMAPLVFVVIVPTLMSSLPGIELTGGWAWVPLTNVALAIKELIKGTMDYYQLIPIFVSSMAIALGTLSFCVYWFNKEKVLFR